MNQLLPIIDLIIIGHNDPIITVIIGTSNNDLVIISSNDIITYAIKNNNHVIKVHYE